MTDEPSSELANRTMTIYYYSGVVPVRLSGTGALVGEYDDD